MSRVTAKYLVETPLDPEATAAVMAGEQSTGTFVKLPNETEEMHRRFGARVEQVLRLDTTSHPSLPRPQARAPASAYHRAEVVLSWSIENMGPSLPNLVTTVAGNLYELQQLSGLRLLDVTVPREFAERYPGPQFGVAGTRMLTGVTGRPLIGTIVKPSVGLSPDETASMVRELAAAGIDFIKDDELMANPPHSPLPARVAAVMAVLKEHEERTGKKVMYAFNITDDLDLMLRHHDTVYEAGGTCVMVSINSAGLAAVAHLRRHCRLPIHAHRTGWGMLSRCPALGMSFTAYQKFWRLAGVDHLHVNGLKNKFCESDDSVIASARACIAPLFQDAGPDYTVMPVFSSGQWAGQVHETYAGVGTNDLIYASGGGLHAHPGGVPGGVASLKQAWEAATRGIPLAEYARDHLELQQAIERFSK